MDVHSREDAVAVYLSGRETPIPEDCHVYAESVLDFSAFDFPDDAQLWSVGVTPGDGRGIFGSNSNYIGPDGKIWTYPANSNFVDPEILKHALFHLYIEGVTDLVDPSTLIDRVSAITKQRDEAIYSLPDAARRGDLTR